MKEDMEKTPVSQSQFQSRHISDMPTTGVHNVTFMHQNHFKFPYE